MTRAVKLFLGVLGGLSATGPMTAIMLALHRRLPASTQYPLPPREIVAKITAPASVEAEALFTIVSHFGYGGAMGGLYAAAIQSPERHWAFKGCAVSLIVWAISYFVLLPLARILRPAHRHPPERNIVMIIAHLVWGVALSGFLASICRDVTSRGLVERSSRPHYDHA